MDKVELIQLIQKLLREFPRHRDIIALCEACEALARAKPNPSDRSLLIKPRQTRAQIQRRYRQRKKEARAA